MTNTAATATTMTMNDTSDRNRNRLPSGIRVFASLVALWLTQPSYGGPEIPGAPQAQPIAIVDATLHPVSRPAIEGGSIVFEQGRITSVGQDIQIPAAAKVISAAGKHVYPGLFNAQSSLGLIEVNAVRASDDRGEVGSWNMNVRAEVAVNPDSELIPVTRSGGVLMNLTIPAGGLLSGTSAVLQLDGWTTEDLTLHAPAAMHLRWPSLAAARHFDDDKQEKDSQQRRDEQLRRIEDVFEKADAYRQAKLADSDLPVDLRWQAMLRVLDGDLPLMVTANRASQIQSAVAFGSRWNVRLILLGGNDAVECAELLKQADVSVVVDGVYRLPLRRDAPYDHRYTLPARLQQAGIRFCIAAPGKFGGPNVRNLPYHAAMAVAFGLTERDALKAITLTPAEMLGMADRVGSLEAGKLATLIVTDGPIFDTGTNVTQAFVQGRMVDLGNRHKRLYHKYRTRQRQLRRTETQ